MATDKSPVLALDKAPTVSGSSGEQFCYTVFELANTLGASQIGASVTKVPPGKAAFPFHHHRANEEHFFVLSGHGVLRFGAGEYEVKAYDYVFHPPGDASVAHQLINTGDVDLVYLGFSTMIVPEIVGYPDSGKTGVRTAYSDDPSARFLISDGLPRSGYWDGEDGRQVTDIVSRHRP
jgi:uncharacterized cupin superfamily protein